MNYKKMRKIASRGGFTLRESNIRPYHYVLINNRTRTEHHYVELDDVRPDIEEIQEGMIPFA